MRKHLPPIVEMERIQHGPYASEPKSGPSGAYRIPSYLFGEEMTIIASTAEHPESAGWEHVSVSLKSRTPSWKEMCIVKDWFWHEEELVVQFHPPRSQYVNIHNNVLHLWRNTAQEITLPPKDLV